MFLPQFFNPPIRDFVYVAAILNFREGHANDWKLDSELFMT